MTDPADAPGSGRRSSPEEADGPPEAPEIARRLQLASTHAVGAAMLVAVVLLAALGVFGESWGIARASSSSVEVSVDYATRYRYKQINRMLVLVTNRSTRVIDTLTVSFDTAYMAGFSNVTITPSPSAAWEVELTGLQPGQARRIVAELQGERYGGHAGSISAWFAGSDTARADVRTFIFP